MLCPACGHLNPSGQRICDRCAVLLPAARGTVVAADAGVHLARIAGTPQAERRPVTALVVVGPAPMLVITIEYAPPI